ncbi:MAG: PfkB family carbohydrate kinase [Pyrinomonadaceae bacterium]
MIVCVSLNPAIDRRLILDQFSLGAVNRARQAQAFPGGKAAHVAMAAQALGEGVIWVGFLGGHIGDQCESGLRDLRINVKRIRTQSETRVNLEILDAARRVTEILEPGGAICASEMEELLFTCAELFQTYGSAAIVALCGSLPPGVPNTFYARLIALAKRNHNRVLLDTSGEALRESLGAAPDL